LQRAHFLLREAMLAAGSAASLAALLLWLGPPGNDLAAHVYQRTVFLHHGFQLWNNFWYGGRYSFVTYSVLYYPLAAVFGIRALAVLSIGIAALAFAIVVCRQYGPLARWSSRTFAVVWSLLVISAAPGGPDETQQRDNFAHNLFAGYAGLKDVHILGTDLIRLAGQQTHQLMAEAKDAKTDADVKLVQWVRFGNGAYLRFLGIAKADSWSDAFPRFRAVRDGVGPRP